MKLYKIFTDIILEETKRILSENVSDEKINDAIANKYNVNITYDDYPESPNSAPSKRYIQVYNFSETSAGNKAIRAFQIFGGSKTTPSSGAWKIFRIDRIRSWSPTNKKFNRPVSDYDPSIPMYNKNGDNTMSKVFNKVDFNKTNPIKRDTTNQNSEKISPDEVNKLNQLKKIKKPESSYIVPTQVKQSNTLKSKNKKINVKKPIDTSNTTGAINNKQINN